MGAAVSSEENAVVLSGLDGAGKSALLRTTRRGQALPTVERSGVVYEVLTLEGASADLLVCDVTAGPLRGASCRHSRPSTVAATATPSCT